MADPPVVAPPAAHRPGGAVPSTTTHVPGTGKSTGGAISTESVIPAGHEGRLSQGPNGLVFNTSGGNFNNHYAIMKELNALNNTASAALMANKDNDAEVANIQLQMQRFTKILGIIEQNMASALQFGLSIIGIHDSIFQRPAFRPS